MSTSPLPILALLAVQPSSDTVPGAPARLEALFSAEGAPILFRAALILILGVPAVFLASRFLQRWLTKHYTAQHGMIGEKLVFYPGLGILLVSFLGQLGFSLAPILGAAGIVGIALGFASQTSVSNIISGFFLIAEQPFRVGDVIQVGTTIGRVLAVDMMSVKLRTFDNRFVRIPNESLVKTEFTNVTRFPIRRLDIPVGVAYKEDIERVRKLLFDVADRNPRCLIEPEPVVRFEGFGESSVNLVLAAWTRTDGWLDFKIEILDEIKTRLDEEGIEIPFPHRTLYAGQATEPFPVRLVGDQARAVPEEDDGPEFAPAED